jgi:hypothetical protein
MIRQVIVVIGSNTNTVALINGFGRNSKLPLSLIFATIMIKFTQTTYDRLQELVTLAGYTIRNEKGNFKSGSCVIEVGKLIVLNKFSTLETRITFLIDAIQKLPIDESVLDDKRLSFLKEVLEFSTVKMNEGLTE